MDPSFVVGRDVRHVPRWRRHVEYEVLTGNEDRVSILDRPARARWPRSQKFLLSPKGLEVESEYREKIVASRSHEGRDSFNAARAAWAQSHNLQPDDGLYLAEVGAGPISLPQIIEALETCGKTRTDAIAAMERLVDSGLIATVV